MLTKRLPDLTVRCEEYQLKFVAFAKAMKSFLLRSSDWIGSKSWITLSFAVQTFILDIFNLAWRDDSKGKLYVGLKAADVDYAIEEDKDRFEVL